ncbi:hypothetical protein [Dyadobacter sp. LHD-138]|uniref:hypothetical protein n=1 Tax=Dyadobacter sp. LHD-138 TaxID=3071413 RepID=UPI0027E02F49|nr:hypothetical protein [Dyadobacter sp. LHD-138]MDQ6479784.1 hypothetical protein [Dyadobacter sp. LHD-138]
MGMNMSEDEKAFILDKAMKDLKDFNPETYEGKGFWMLSGYDDILYEVSFKPEKLDNGRYQWKINTIRKWEG